VAKESLKSRTDRGRHILSRLREQYGDAECALNHRNALELLVATILSAQSTDVNVNLVTKTLFKKYRMAADYAAAPREGLEADIRSTGFFRQKAKNVQATCQIIVDQHGGKVPDTMEALTALPGVARKTANVVLGTWFGKNEGVVVDTHVGRLAERLGLTWTSKNSKDAIKIEKDLQQVIPQEEWTFVSHALIWHGRKVCSARKPDCDKCTLWVHCPSAFKVNGASGTKAKGVQEKSAGKTQAKTKKAKSKK
jgi:endonuclease-3